MSTDPSADPEPAAEAVRRFGGRADYRDLRRHVTDSAIKRAVSSGDLVRAARGVFVLAGLPQALSVAAACRGVVSHQSAAQLLGLEMLQPPGEVHVTAGRGARPPVMKRVVVHRRDLGPGEVDGEVTTVVRTVLDCCLSLPFREALAVADSAARADPGFVQEFRAAADRPIPGRPRRLAVGDAVSTLAANPFESALRGELIGAGITSFAPQVPILTRRGHRIVADLADVVRRIAIEADSFRWHGDPRKLTEDCRRYNDLVADGWLVLRFAYDQVMFDPAWVVDTTRQVLRRAG